MPAEEYPQRPSLVANTAAIIRKGIFERRYDEGLPGERALAIQFGVSRPTVRKALETLRSEGILEVSHGKRTLPTALAQRRSARMTRARPITLLCPEPLHRLSGHALFVIDTLRSALAAAGLSLETRVFHPPAGSEQKAVRKLLAEDRSAIRVLYRQEREIHRLLHAEGADCVVFGDQHPAHPLPAVGLDHAATSRHALNHLRRNGFPPEAIALVVPHQDLSGHSTMISVFREEVGESARIVELPSLPEALPAALDRLCEKLPAPAALVFVRSRHALAALGHLSIVRRLRVPQELSVIALSHDPVFEFFRPMVTCYKPAGAEIAGALAAKVIRATSGAKLSAKATTFFPEFIGGQTVARRK